MIARKNLPESYRKWNTKWTAPYGRRRLLPAWGPLVWIEAKWRGPFGWQGRNNTTRIFEYPWAYHAIARRGSGLRILEIGGGLSGLQFVLAIEGNHVVNVDPGQEGLGWRYQSDLHGRLCRSLGAPVQLFDKKIDLLQAPPSSFDVVLSVSALEHFSDGDLIALASAVKRLLEPDGIVVMTIDLFLDLKPFSGREENEWGRNLDVRQFLNMAGLRLEDGCPAELLGFPEFNHAKVLANLATYFLGEYYPTLSQCVVARLDDSK
jgi:2-polyprenyl-3-methyl-5-hydroxy-6-metoxy-1,4-benzoquinol methylase